MNNENSFKDFIFNNVSASIINTMLAVAFCIVVWMYLAFFSSNPAVDEFLFTLIAYTLFWAVPMFIYNYIRYKSGHRGRQFALTILIPYAVCLFAGSVYISLGAKNSFAKESIRISDKKLSLEVGEQEQLSLKSITKKQAKNVTWKSSDKTVAVVNKKGLVTAKDKGSAKITAKYNKKKYTCRVTVKGYPKPVQAGGIEFLTNKDERIRCHYSDKLLSESSVKYNKELAKCSLATAILSDNTIIPSSESGNKSQLEELVDNFGFEGFAVNDEYKVKPTDDSVGVACAYKNICGDCTAIAVMIRSTAYDAEWSSNMDMGDGSDILNHRGFEMSRRKVSAFVLDYIKKLNIEGDITFWVSGQSRGAAIANLTAAWLMGDEAKSSGINTSKDMVYAYCFATPQAAYAGTGAERKDLKTGYENIHNMIFDRDLVSRIPPEQFGFGIYGVQEKGVYGKDENEVKNIVNVLNEKAYNAFVKAENADYGGMSRAEWVNSYENKLVELVVDRKTYTAEWQDTFTYGVMLMFTNTTPANPPDQAKSAQLMAVLISGGENLFTDHYPQTEYAYIATAR